MHGIKIEDLPLFHDLKEEELKATYGGSAPDLNRGEYFFRPVSRTHVSLGLPERKRRVSSFRKFCRYK